MTKYHISESGVRPCRATLKDCPIGGAHFSSSSEAQQNFESGRKIPLEGLSKAKMVISDNQLPVVSIESNAALMKNGSYIGVVVPSAYIEAHLETWRDHVGITQAADMELSKIQRDGGHHFHITLITPKELRAVRKSGGTLKDFPAFTFQTVGIGTVSDGNKEAWYVTCRSEQADAWRASYGLEPKDYHITIGFVGGDVHTKSKYSDTVVIT